MNEIRGVQLWKKVLQIFAPFGSFNLNIKNYKTKDIEISDEFALQISFINSNLKLATKKGNFVFQIFLIPKSEETRQKWYKMSENQYNMSIFPMLWLYISFKIQDPIFPFTGISLYSED